MSPPEESCGGSRRTSRCPTQNWSQTKKQVRKIRLPIESSSVKRWDDSFNLAQGVRPIKGDAHEGGIYRCPRGQFHCRRSGCLSEGHQRWFCLFRHRNSFADNCVLYSQKETGITDAAASAAGSPRDQTGIQPAIKLQSANQHRGAYSRCYGSRSDSNSCTNQTITPLQHRVRGGFLCGGERR